MEWMSHLFDLSFSRALEQFMTSGGPVLWWLAALILVFWLIVIERVFFLLFAFPNKQKNWLDSWRERDDHHSWYAQKEREAWMNQAHLLLFQNVNILKLVISLFPMLGLLGTVTGMISVFDVLAIEGTSQPRLMASGISMATLPTMAGLVAALVGVFCYSHLFSVLRKREIHLEKLMRSRS